MKTSDREYKQLDRIKGISLKGNVMLYKIAPDEQERRDLWIGSHITELSPKPKPRWTWDKIVLLIVFFGLAVWFWYEAMN